MQKKSYSREFAADYITGMLHATLLVGFSMAAGLLVLTVLS